MQLQTFKTLWGNKLPIVQACQQAKSAGFDGIEGRAPQASATTSWLEALNEHQCQYIAEIVSGEDYVPNRQWTIQKHLDDIERQIEASQALDPLFATCIIGCDAWPESEAIKFFENVLLLQEKSGLQLSIETHRSRPTFNPWSTLRIAQALPEMKLTADISHWCVVCERLMDSEMDTLEKLIPQIHHIHARVGYDQGPQVPDPRAPEYLHAMNSHMNYWQQAWAYHLQSVRTDLTMTPEFGPDGYCHLQPYTQMPVVDLWEVNQWMRQQIQQAFNEYISSLN